MEMFKQSCTKILTSFILVFSTGILYAQVPTHVDTRVSAVPYAGNLMGIGMFPEAIGQNPIRFVGKNSCIIFRYNQRIHFVLHNRIYQCLMGAHLMLRMNFMNDWEHRKKDGQKAMKNTMIILPATL